MSSNKQNDENLEKFLKSSDVDPTAKFFVDVLKDVSPEIQDEILERQRKILTIANFLENSLKHILTSDIEKSQFIDEMKKRVKVKD